MNNPRLQKLYQSTDLGAILARPTELKPEVSGSSNDFEESLQTEELEDSNSEEIVSESNNFDFLPQKPENGRFSIPEPTIEQPIEEPYDAERNARSLVYGLQAIDTPILTTIGVFKLRKSVGGKKVIDQMREAIVKEMEGEELTEKDQRLLKSFAVYEKKMQALQTTLLPDEAATNHLITMATDYCEESRINVSPALGFYSNYAGALVSKITTVLLT